MNTRLRSVTAMCLVMGALLGVAGTFAPSETMRSVAWGIDGTLLIVATALLTIHHTRQGNDLAASGFLVFVAGETLIVSGSAMELAASAPLFAAGVGLWAASLTLVSSSTVMPMMIRSVGFIAAMLFAAVALQIFAGQALTPLTRPLPFFAYPFLAATLFGWAWTTYRAAG